MLYSNSSFTVPAGPIISMANHSDLTSQSQNGNGIYNLASDFMDEKNYSSIPIGGILNITSEGDEPTTSTQLLRTTEMTSLSYDFYVNQTSTANVWSNLTFNNSANGTNTTQDHFAPKWWILTLSVIILATAMGNILVCLAVYWERRLQNMTNYFLMSLAIADLLVAVLVMPLGMVIEIYGFFPLHPSICVLWASADVLMCTASIWHMCIMSMDRYFTLKYPMKYGRRKTKTNVAIKITIVWVVSMTICSPVFVLGYVDYTNVYNHGLCLPAIRPFVLYGSIFAFYVPLVIMFLTYALTISILHKNQQRMKNMAQKTNKIIVRSGGDGFMSNTFKTIGSIFGVRVRPNPHGPRQSTDNSIDLSYSYSLTHSSSETDERKYIPMFRKGYPRDSLPNKLSDPPVTKLDNQNCQERTITTAIVNDTHIPDINVIQKKSITRSNPEMNVHQNLGQACSLNSAGTSLNSMLSDAHCSSGGSVSEESTDIQEKLSQIEQEMDECLRENAKLFNCSVRKKHLQCLQQEKDMLKEKAAGKKRNFLGRAFSTRERRHNDTKAKSDRTKYKNKLRHTQSAPLCQPEESSDESDSATTQSDLRTIHLKPQGCYVYKMTDPSELGSESMQIQTEEVSQVTERPMSPPPDTELTQRPRMTTLSSLRRKLTFKKPKPYKIKGGHHRSANGVISKVIKWNDPAFYAANGSTTQIMSKRRASNEKKASKVLGIIFVVFVVLWTPFFILNVLSATCDSCMQYVTPWLMAIIVWLGWLASLANPIIYTMFNTSFRRAFYNVLTCKYSRRSRNQRPPDTMLYSTNTNWLDERRATMTWTMMPLRE